MFLSGISVLIIQRVGRWSSEAFLEYIRKQFESFTVGVSKKMSGYEEFLNLNAETELENNLPPELLEDQCENEDGPVSVPFRVNFNNISFTMGKESE